MKHVVVLLLGCLFTSYCSAQGPGELGGPSNKGGKHSSQSPVQKIAVMFLPTDTCNLKINEVDGGNVVKETTVNKNSSKTISLRLGNYSLLFESLETGKIIKNRSFRLTKDSLKDGKYRYPVSFK